MATLASLDDLAALGAIPVDTDEASAHGVRAVRLLELVSGAVLVLLDGFGISATDVLGDDDEIEGWPEFRRDALAVVVAEIAAKRLNVSAASSVDPFGTTEGPQTLKLNRWEKRAIIETLPLSDGDEATAAGDWFKP